VLCGFVTGRVDLFLRFIVEELKPLIDATYRTRPGREHTFASGLSFGGLFALYAGWEHSDTFGAVAPQSASLWVPNFTQRLLNEPRRPGLRIYLDYGTGEHRSITRTNASFRDSLLLREPGYVVEGDLRFFLGFGQTHNFTAGGSRLESLMTFLWPATREASEAAVPLAEARAE
jgi:predicted alpha/beta superfamily hydrolase